MSMSNATVSTSTLWGSGNRILETTDQGSTYQSWGWTTPLLWGGALAQPTPVGTAIVPPTVGVEYPHTLFTGVADGYWVYHLYLNGHLQGTYTFTDRVFAVAVPFDRIESVAVPFAGTPEPENPGCHPHTPGPGGAAVLLCAALLTRFRNRKA